MLCWLGNHSPSESEQATVGTVPPGVSPQGTGSSARPLQARTSSRDLSVPIFFSDMCFKGLFEQRRIWI